MSQTTDLTVGNILSNAFRIGIKNAPSLIGAILLWVLTLWIPYLNVGTTIGLFGLIAKMGRGSVLSPTEIFDPAYRKQMGEFFLVIAFTGTAVLLGEIFLIIPGIVIAMAWSLAPVLVVDKGLNPTAALQLSNDLTYGKKWTMFFGSLSTCLVSLVGVVILFGLGHLISNTLGLILAAVGYVAAMAIGVGAQAYVYHTLTSASGSAPLAPETVQ